MNQFFFVNNLQSNGQRESNPLATKTEQIHRLTIAYFYLIILILPATLSAQALPISIDGQFDDWTNEAIEWIDNSSDGDQIELLRMAIANDETHLFVLIEMDEEINLTDDQNLTLYIDTDMNASTGQAFNDIGAEISINFGDRDVFYQLPSGQGSMSLNDLLFRHQPTVTSHRFEMAFDLSVVSNAGFDLFTSDVISLVWKDETGPFGDALPNDGHIFSYTIDESPTPSFELIDLNKSSSNALRLMTWNTLQDGLDDIERGPIFKKVIEAMQPDIVTFNECWNINSFQVASFMNAAAPLPNFQNWNTVKIDNGNVTASRYPIVQNWIILPNQRLTASLIDLPDELSSTDLLVVNAHFRCCENNFDRQREADAFVAFIQDAKTPGGQIDLPANTPFVLSGDLNLVGNSQQLKTLLTGEIVNTGQFGMGGSMDWDGSDLMDVISTHTDDRFTYTWNNPFSSFPPSRIDFHILSPSVLAVEKTFTIETAGMSEERKEAYGLTGFDINEASDHLPKITDLLLPAPVATIENTQRIDLKAFPNPSNGQFQINYNSLKSGTASFSLLDKTGKILREWQQAVVQGDQSFLLELNEMASGSYYLNVVLQEEWRIIKLIIQ